MIFLENFTPEVRKYNTIKYLENIIKMANNNEGFVSLHGNHVVFKRYLIGNVAQTDLSIYWLSGKYQVSATMFWNDRSGRHWETDWSIWNGQ